ncbi:lytic polysaccharide monooxygenase [Cellulosimicrobium terreum]|nr:lytic polysaccharide monooxygenase [Cellulosimicrobium terreum]
MRKLRAALLAAALGALAIIAPVAVAPSASAHGWITSPPSRQDNCAKGATSFDCGPITYEPQSVEAPKGSKQCSGGSGFNILDDSSKPWPRTQTGSTVTFQWKLTAAHNTSTWEYFVDGVLFRTYDQGGAQPPSNISHTLTNLPEGNHTILARWNVSNTAMAFYNCVDIKVGAGGTDPGDPDPDPTDPTDPEPGDCTAAAWSAGGVYLGGARVSQGGHTYEAKWWTTGENPGQSGQWGAWKDLGAC